MDYLVRTLRDLALGIALVGLLTDVFRCIPLFWKHPLPGVALALPVAFFLAVLILQNGDYTGRAWTVTVIGAGIVLFWIRR